MAEVTRVPLQPIAKGSLTKLWLGVRGRRPACRRARLGAMPQGVSLTVDAAGDGPKPGTERRGVRQYTGKLADGTVFDKSQDSTVPIQGIFPEGTPLPLERLIPGFTEALLQMQKGGKYEIRIPADKAYGAEPPSAARRSRRTAT